MGNDGGSIPTRRELVKSAARAPTISEMKATALESLSHAWNHDPVTSNQLDMENVVSDWQGRLFNYETVLQGLLPSHGKDEAPQLVGNGTNGHDQEITFTSTRIKSIRDIVKLKFKRNTPGGIGSEKKALWVCPISQKELGPATKSVYLVPCGHVFAEVAIREIADKTCPECNEAFESRDVITVLPTEKAELERLGRRIDELKATGLTHSLKKEKGDKKKKRQKADEAGREVENGQDAPEKPADQNNIPRAPKTSNTGITSRVSGINNATAASLTAKVLAEQEERNKRRKLAAAR